MRKKMTNNAMRNFKKDLKEIGKILIKI